MNACAMGDSSQFFADLTIRHPENDNAELLGTAARSRTR